jgi:hypothetical protein
MQPQQPEPTLGDVLRAVNDLATYTAGQFTRVDARLGQLDAAIGTVRAEVGSVSAKVDQVRADIAAVKVDVALAEAHISDLQEAVRRHTADPGAHGNAA